MKNTVLTVWELLQSDRLKWEHELNDKLCVGHH